MYSNRFFKGQEEIELPKKQLEINYEKSLIPELYKNLIERKNCNSRKLYSIKQSKRNAKSINKAKKVYI